MPRIRLSSPVAEATQDRALKNPATRPDPALRNPLPRPEAGWRLP